MKTVVAVVRTTSLENVIGALEKIGVKGVTISEVRGLGSEVSLGSPYTIHKRIEIIVPDAAADMIANVIAEQAHTGLPGDGLIAVNPTEYLVRIRSKEKLQ